MDPTADPLTDLRSHVSSLLARDEHDAVEVEVQHLLISFDGTGTGASRSKDEAEALSADLFERISSGADFDEMVRNHTDDAHPGKYSMTTGKPGQGVFARSGMVAAFGDIGWRLEVGTVGVAGFDPKTSPYGWHIIKRLR